MKEIFFVGFTVVAILALYFRLKLNVGFVKKEKAIFELGGVLTTFLFGVVILTDIYPINSLGRLFGLLIVFYATLFTLYLLKIRFVKEKRST